ncbi:MAG: hypothetical protein BM564_09615 [Bacteroidetes bacterium MedPE-SWsnd-G2]|nr:MAG: hypothetical protein BM564_09615 [Bacteroidetes bacterium MedPE-SWsnd-G2]
MKTKLLIILGLIFSLSGYSQVLDRLEDFEDETTMGWAEGGVSPNPPVYIATGGPLGTDDGFLENYSSGTPGAGGRMAMFSTNWAGDYSTIGVAGFTMDAKVLGTETLYLRIALESSTLGQVCSTQAIEVLPGGAWTNYYFPMDASSLTLLPSSASTVEEVLDDVATIRIISAELTPEWIGDRVDATLQVDNVDATDQSLSIDSNKQDEFKVTMSPNPATNLVNVSLGNGSNGVAEIYDILGKKVMTQQINNGLAQLNVQGLNSGIYMVKVISDSKQIVMRLIRS